MATRMRIVSWEVRPLVMADDGDSLVPVEIPPIRIPMKEWEAFKSGGDEAALSPIREEIEDPEAPGEH